MIKTVTQAHTLDNSSKNDTLGQTSPSRIGQLFKFGAGATLFTGLIAAAIIATVRTQPDLAKDLLGDKSFDNLNGLVQQYATRDGLSNILTSENVSRAVNASSTYLAETFSSDNLSSHLELAQNKTQEFSRYMQRTCTQENGQKLLNSAYTMFGSLKNQTLSTIEEYTPESIKPGL